MPNTRRFLTLFLISTLFAGGAIAARPTAAPPGAKVLHDVVFAKVGGRALHMDIVVPADAPTKPHPAVVWVHGGGWRLGSYKQNQAAWMAAHGYVAVSIEYRLTDEAIYPAQIYDCKAAIRYLRAHASEYGIDPNRIGVWGASAGGHLTALLGTTGEVKQLEGDEDNPGVSSRVQAVCDFFGPADFTLPWPITPRPVYDLLGGSASEKKALAKLASPVKFVSRDDPPFLIVHGDADLLVPISQSEELHSELKKAGVDVAFTRVKNAGHGFTGTSIQPTREEINNQVLAFFDKHLKATAR